MTPVTITITLNEKAMVVIVIDYFNCNRDYFSRLLLKLVEHFLFFLNTMDRYHYTKFPQYFVILCILFK